MGQTSATNTNPVLSVDKNGYVLYSNDAGNPLLNEWDVRVGEKLPSSIVDFVQKVISGNSPEKIEVKVGKKVYLVVFHPSPEEERVKVSGFDISDQKEHEEKFRIKERQNDVLHQIGKIALEYGNLQMFMDESVKMIADILDLEYCKIMELLPDGKFLMRAGTGWKPEFVGKQVVRGEKESQAGYTLLSGVPLIVENFEEEKRFNKPEILRIHGVASGASVIIGSKENIFGVLVVNSTKKRKFTHDDTYFLNSVAFLIAQKVERKNAEESLRESEERFRSVLENSLDMAYRRNLQADRYDYISPMVEQISGFSTQETITMSVNEVLDHIHPDERSQIASKLAQALDAGFGAFEYRFKCKDGKYRWLADHFKVVKDQNGNPYFMSGVVRDITERKKIEEALLESESCRKAAEAVASERQRLFDVLETLPVMVCLLTPDYHVAFANRSFREKFGESEGRRCYEYCFGRTEPCEFCEAYKVLETNKPHNWEVTIRDGSVIDVHALPFTDVDGSPMIIEMKIDITDRRKAEEKLRESEEKYRNIVETANEGISIINNKGIVTYTNQKMADMLGYTIEEVVNKAIWDFIDEDIKPIVTSQFEKRKSVHNESYELRLRRKDGSPIWLIVNVKSLFDKNNNFTGILNLHTDITERKRVEEALRNLEIARQKEIHHRIKNNLQVISSLLDLQADKFNNRELIKYSEVLEAFKESQNRVISMALIHEELHKGERLGMLNFSSYIEELAEGLLMAYVLENNAISLNMDLDQNIFFEMDIAIPLGIVINELISNSLKYAFSGRDKGEIRIKLQREEGKRTAYILSVSDDGIGIPENLDIEDLDSLGLQLVATLVEQLDGELELKRDNGTEFIIRFSVRGNSDRELKQDQLEIANND